MITKSYNFDPITITTRIAVVCAALVIIAAGVLGFTALYDLFVSIGLFAAWLGLFFPLLFDLAEITAAVSVFNAKLQGEDDRFAWRMVLLFTGLGVIANIAHASHAAYIGRIDAAQLLLAIFATSLFPLSVALVTHLLKKVIDRAIRRANETLTLAGLTGQRETLAAEVNKLTAQWERLSSQLDELKTDKQAHYTTISDDTRSAALDILRNAPDITGAELARQLDKSASTGRRLRRELLPIVSTNGHEAPA